MGTSGTGHDRCPSHLVRAHSGARTPPTGGDKKLAKPIFVSRGARKIFEPISASGHAQDLLNHRLLRVLQATGGALARLTQLGAGARASSDVPFRARIRQQCLHGFSELEHPVWFA